ncbi:DUF6303 family protein [Streptomyces sp. NPDC059175]|uniref:DUF6303 family protein n=1 Tax=Streptomyces sp. NPDC059175 TaxID=3346757 RepID=UPI0036B37749
MAAGALFAHLTNGGGVWQVYVIRHGLPVCQWPAHVFPAGAEVPSVQERSRALNALGFVFTHGGCWEWVEFSVDPADPSSPVRFLAATTVREVAS